ncbi:MAG: Gfo/Idh/MocA family oxidoreductase [Dehalococcoidia bacterium]|nr:Gfo/Idh/MocA family oxidoreductase [Dehalococcoidia bacterium]
MRIGVIGVGFGSRVQIPGFQSESLEVVAVCTRRREGAERSAQEHGIPGVYTDYRQMRQHPGLDAVSIATPPASHHEIALAALNAGKHVLCEKAFAMNQAEARAMWQKAEQTGLTAMVAHEFRFAPARAYVKELLQQGYVRDIRSVHINLFMGPTRMPSGPRPMTWAARLLRAVGSSRPWGRIT